MTVFLYRIGVEKRTFRIVAFEDNQEVPIELPNVTFTVFTPQHTCLSALIAAIKHYKSTLDKLGLEATEPTSIDVREYHGMNCIASYTVPHCHNEYITRIALT